MYHCSIICISFLLVTNPSYKQQKSSLKMEAEKYLILDDSRGNGVSQTASRIAAFFINEMDMKVHLVTKEEIKGERNKFAEINDENLKKLFLHTAKDLDLLIKKIMYIDTINIERSPQVFILDALVRLK